MIQLQELCVFLDNKGVMEQCSLPCQIFCIKNVSDLHPLLHPCFKVRVLSFLANFVIFDEQDGCLFKSCSHKKKQTNNSTWQSLEASKEGREGGKLLFIFQAQIQKFRLFLLRKMLHKSQIFSSVYKYTSLTRDILLVQAKLFNL